MKLNNFYKLLITILFAIIATFAFVQIAYGQTLGTKLLHWYSFDSITSDSHGSGSITLYNGVFQSGLNNTGIYVDGTSDNNVTATVSGNHEAWGIAFWANFDNGSYGKLRGREDTSPDLYMYYVNQYIYIHTSNGTSTSCNYSEIGGLLDGTRHIVLTSDGSTLTLYLDGNVCGTPFSSTTNLQTDLKLGDASDDAKSGLYDELAIFSDYLTSGDVADLYSGGTILSYNQVVPTPPVPLQCGTYDGQSVNLNQLENDEFPELVYDYQNTEYIIDVNFPESLDVENLCLGDNKAFVVRPWYSYGDEERKRTCKGPQPVAPATQETVNCSTSFNNTQAPDPDIVFDFDGDVMPSTGLYDTGYSRDNWTSAFTLIDDDFHENTFGKAGLVGANGAEGRFTDNFTAPNYSFCANIKYPLATTGFHGLWAGSYESLMIGTHQNPNACSFDYTDEELFCDVSSSSPQPLSKNLASGAQMFNWGEYCMTFETYDPPSAGIDKYKQIEFYRNGEKKFSDSISDSNHYFLDDSSTYRLWFPPYLAVDNIRIWNNQQLTTGEVQAEYEGATVEYEHDPNYNPYGEISCGYGHTQEYNFTNTPNELLSFNTDHEDEYGPLIFNDPSIAFDEFTASGYNYNFFCDGDATSLNILGLGPDGNVRWSCSNNQNTTMCYAGLSHSNQQICGSLNGQYGDQDWLEDKVDGIENDPTACASGYTFVPQQTEQDYLAGLRTHTQTGRTQGGLVYTWTCADDYTALSCEIHHNEYERFVVDSDKNQLYKQLDEALSGAGLTPYQIPSGFQKYAELIPGVKIFVRILPMITLLPSDRDVTPTIYIPRITENGAGQVPLVLQDTTYSFTCNDGDEFCTTSGSILSIDKPNNTANTLFSYFIPLIALIAYLAGVLLIFSIFIALPFTLVYRLISSFSTQFFLSESNTDGNLISFVPYVIFHGILFVLMIGLVVVYIPEFLELFQSAKDQIYFRLKQFVTLFADGNADNFYTGIVTVNASLLVLLIAYMIYLATRAGAKL